MLRTKKIRSIENAGFLHPFTEMVKLSCDKYDRCIQVFLYGISKVSDNLFSQWGGVNGHHYMFLENSCQVIHFCQAARYMDACLPIALMIFFPVTNVRHPIPLHKWFLFPSKIFLANGHDMLLFSRPCILLFLLAAWNLETCIFDHAGNFFALSPLRINILGNVYGMLLFSRPLLF